MTSGYYVDPQELLPEAKKVVIEYQKGSTSLLQRRLKISYFMASELLRLLEIHGVVGPENGPKPREVLVKQ